MKAVQYREVGAKPEVVSVPDPDSVDVLGMDPTHRTVIGRRELEARGFTVTSALFYGGHYSAGRNDALFAVWARACAHVNPNCSGPRGTR